MDNLLFCNIFQGVKLISNAQTSAKRISVGRVEVYENGTWSAICDKKWTAAEANVTCTDLGFSGVYQELSLPLDAKETKTFLRREYRCAGKEEYLIKCNKSNEIRSTCPGKMAAGVRCKAEGILFKLQSY